MTDQHTLFTDCGIDSFGFYAPKFYIDIEDLAKARNVDPDKYKKGLMIKELRFPDYNEDIVSMGLKAGYNALQRGEISPKDIDALFCGTETITYSVKSVSNIYAQMLGIPANCLTQDIYNACAGGTLAILNAIAQIEQGYINKALVICVDIASYQLGSPGEPTQGSGATAFVISKNPRVLSFSKNFGKVSGNVNDFWRNVGEKFASVFGQYSVNSYINFQLKAYDDLIQKIGNFKCDYYVFHAPFPKLPLKCMQALLKERWITNIKKYLQNNINFPNLCNENNFMLDLRGIPTEIYLKLIKEGIPSSVFEKNSEYLSNTLKRMMLPQLRVPMYFGNMYCAAIWAQIIYIIENYALPDNQIYFGSYGSGAICVSGLLKVQKRFKEVVKNISEVKKYLTFKERKNISEYEKIKANNYFSKKVLGKIVEHKKNNNRGFKLYFCDEGCIIPNIKGIDRCPKGHSGKHEKFFPLFAELIEEPIVEKKNNGNKYLTNGYVQIESNVRKGDLLEYEIRQVFNSNEVYSNNKGLLNWVPIYVSINHLY